MRRKQGIRVMAAMVAAVLAAALAAALLSLQVLALSDNAQAVVTRLETMQGANIDPAWTPDIEANQAAVQELLDLYKKCSPAEREEFTAEQNSSLRAYFDALYEVQGKDTAELDDLFAGRSVVSGAAPSSSQPSSSAVGSSSGLSSSSSTPGSSSGASASSSASGQSSSQAASSQSGAPEPSSSVPVVSPVSGLTSSGGVPSAAYPPQVPGGDGSFGFFGSKAISALLLVLICALAAVVFVRFLVSLRAAGKVKADEQDAAMQELHGSVDPYTLPPLEEEPSAFLEVGEAPPLPRDEKRAAKRAEREEKAAKKADEKSEKPQEPESNSENDVNNAFSVAPVWGGKAFTADDLRAQQMEKTGRAELEKQAAMGGLSDPVSVGEKGRMRGKRLEPDKRVEELAELPGLFEAAGGVEQAGQPAERPGQGATPQEAAQSAQPAPGTLFGQSFVTLPTGAPRGATKYGARTGAGEVGDAQPRPGARTGKPKKMTFHQGRPEDIDAIDD